MNASTRLDNDWLQQLLVRLQSLEATEFERLKDGLMNLANGLFHITDDDAAHTVIAELLTKISDAEFRAYLLGRTSPLQTLCTTFKHDIATYYRRENRHRGVARVDDDNVATMEASIASSEDRLIADEEARELLSLLTARERDLFRIVYGSGRKVKSSEVAKQIGTTRSAAYSQLFRMHKKLRVLFGVQEECKPAGLNSANRILVCQSLVNQCTADTR